MSGTRGTHSSSPWAAIRQAPPSTPSSTIPNIPVTLPTNTPRAKRSISDFKQSLTDPIVEIQCGTPPVKYQVHKYMLSAASSYFRAAFGGDFKEGQEGCLKLTDEDPEIFVIVLRAVYEEELVFDDPKEEADEVNKAVATMIKVYIACDMYDLPAFKPAALHALNRYYDVLWTKLQKGVAFGQIVDAYKHTPEGSALRELIARRAASNYLVIRNTRIKERAKKYSSIMAEIPEFGADFIRILSQAAGQIYNDPLSWSLEEPKSTENILVPGGNGNTPNSA